MILALVSLVLAAAAILRAPRFRAERLVLPVLLASTWPSALLGPVEAATGVGRGGAIAGASTLLLLALCLRMMRARRALPAAERGATMLLERAFPDLVPLARAELGLLWFGLFRWRRDAADVPVEAIAFPGTATGTEFAMCLLTASGFVIETPLMHLLLAHVTGAFLAWFCTGLHLILGIYLIGYAKSLRLRPTLLFADRLEIRLGVLARRVVPRASIESLTATHGGKTIGAGERRLFGLDEPNLRVSVDGIGLLFRVDEPKQLMRALGTA